MANYNLNLLCSHESLSHYLYLYLMSYYTDLLWVFCLECNYYIYSKISFYHLLFHFISSHDLIFRSFLHLVRNASGSLNSKIEYYHTNPLSTTLVPMHAMESADINWLDVIYRGHFLISLVYLSIVKLIVAHLQFVNSTASCLFMLIIVHQLHFIHIMMKFYLLIDFRAFC